MVLLNYDNIKKIKIRRNIMKKEGFYINIVNSNLSNTCNSRIYCNTTSYEYNKKSKNISR